MVALDLLARKDITALEQVLDALSNMQKNEMIQAMQRLHLFKLKVKLI